MDNKKTKQLLKILIGAAWIDGTIQPEERTYLHRMAREKDLGEDPEIKSLFAEAKPVKADQCYQWLEEYLGSRPSDEDYQALMEAISTLVYSDNIIDTQEAELLNRLQMLDPANESAKSVFNQVLKAIQKLYRKAISQ